MLKRWLVRLSFLFANHIAQNASKQADVVDQGLFFVRARGGLGGAGRRWAHGGMGWGLFVRSRRMLAFKAARFASDFL